MVTLYWFLCSTMPLILILVGNNPVVEGLGVNWGTQTVHQLPPKTVVQMIKDNGIKKVKLFDADANTLTALAGSGIEVMVAIPNGDLAAMNEYSRAKEWVRRNVTRYSFNGGVNIKYVAVGNEPFLTSYKDRFINVTFPALQNIQKALNEAKLGDSIKATVPLNAGVYTTPTNNEVPSAGTFRTDIADLVTDMVKFLAQNNAPFTVNIYPFLSLYDNPNFPFNYAFFDGETTPVVDNGVSYTNAFDANFDTLVSALKAIGHGDMPIMVGEIGWPTNRDKNADLSNAHRFYRGLLPRILGNVGTPLRAGYIEVYLFGLLDEEAKSVEPGNFERHWGIFRYDGQPKFPMDLMGNNQNVYLKGASSVQYLPNQWCMVNPSANGNATLLAEKINYACTFADCTPLGYGCSCAGLDADANATFAFNAYYQAQSQEPEACDFQGFAVVTKQNVSQGSCNFTIQIDSSATTVRLMLSVLLMFLSLICFLI